MDQAMTCISLRETLVTAALRWEAEYGVMPAITSSVSELDAAILLGMTEAQYSDAMKDRTAVSKGYDFVYQGIRYQIKANRPSGKKGSTVTLVSKAKNYDWDFLIWILYDPQFQIQGAWLWQVQDYRNRFESMTRLSPKDMRLGKEILLQT